MVTPLLGAGVASSPESSFLAKPLHTSAGMEAVRGQLRFSLSSVRLHSIGLTLHERLERLFHPLPIQRRTLEKPHSMLTSPPLSISGRYRSQTTEVRLVPHEQDLGVGPVVLNFSEPSVNGGEGGGFGDVVYEEGAYCTAVVRGCDCSVALLTSCGRWVCEHLRPRRAWDERQGELKTAGKGGSPLSQICAFTTFP